MPGTLFIPFYRQVYFARHRAAFGPLDQPQVDALNDFLLFLGADTDLPDLRWAAYLLGTAWHETAKTLRPIHERGSRAYIDSRYDPIKGSTPARRARARTMGNLKSGDGWRYRGRGFVQLTWAKNYQRVGQALGLPLLDDPDLALVPAHAYEILSVGLRLGWFTGAKLGDFLTPGRADYLGARRCVNGADQAALIAQYARGFEAALTAAAAAH